MVTAHSKQDQEHELAASSSQYLRTRPEHFWRLNAVLGQWYRAVNLRPAITATIFFGLFSLIYVPVLAGESSLDKILNLLLILVGIFVVSLLVGGAITFHTSSPQLFAQAVIAGRPAREVFYFTAKQIKKVSGKFSRVFEHIDAGFSGHLNEIAKQDSGGWKIKIGNYKKEFDGEKAKKIADKIQQLGY